MSPVRRTDGGNRPSSATPSAARRPAAPSERNETPRPPKRSDRFDPASGPRAPSLDGQLDSELGAEGIARLEVLAAFKALVGGAQLDTSGSRLLIKDNRLTEAQLAAAVRKLFGESARLDADGSFAWRESGVSAELGAAFEKSFQALKLDGEGRLSFSSGEVEASAQASLEKVLGRATIVSGATVTFEDGHFKAELDEQLTVKFGADASLGASVRPTLGEDGLEKTAIGLAAFKRLKQLGKDGSLEMKGDGELVIKDGKVDRAEVSALLSAVAGKGVHLDSRSKLVWEDGKLDADFSGKLAKAWKTTSLDAGGSLRLEDGKPEYKANLGGLFKGSRLSAGGNVELTGLDSAKLSLKLATLGAGTKIDATGSLVLDKKGFTAKLSTNLLSGAGSTAGVGLDGLVTVSDSKRAAELKAKLQAGMLDGTAGVGSEATVERYRPGANDPHRLAVEKAGGFWSERGARFTANADAGVKGTVLVGSVPLTLGFGATGSLAREVRTLTIHPSEEDAKHLAPVTVLRPPTTIDAVLAMRPYEMISESGEQAIGFHGSVALGVGAGPAQLEAGGQVYYQVTGELSRDVERLEGSRVRVRFRRGAGRTDVKALSASVGLSVPGGGKAGEKLAPVLEQIARAGLTASLETSKQGETCFDFTFDLEQPGARAAFAHVLRDELGEAQTWAEVEGSGVELRSSMETRVSARMKTAKLEVGPLTSESVERWADKAVDLAEPGNLVFATAFQHDERTKPLLPWKPSERVTVKFVRQTRTHARAPTPQAGEVATDGVLRVRMPSAAEAQQLSRTQSLLGVRLVLSDPMTSLDDLRRGQLRPALALMRSFGFSEEELRPLADLDAALASGAAPAEKPIASFVVGAGDRRFEKTALDFEGFVAPRGFFKIFHRPAKGPDAGPGLPYRTREDFVHAYLDLEGEREAEPPVLSRRGLVEAIAKTTGCALVASGDGVALQREGRTIGTLSGRDLERLRERFVAALPAPLGGVALEAGVGRFEPGAAPRPLLRVGYLDCRRDAGVLERARTFADGMVEATAVFERNRARVSRDGVAAQGLFSDPERYFDEIEAAFRNVMQRDKGRATAPLTLLRLAGPDGIFVRSELALAPEIAKAMVEAGRARVQRFGAVALLARMGAKLTFSNELLVPVTGAAGRSAVQEAEQKRALAAAKVLFGEGASLTSETNAYSSFGGLKLEAAQRDALMQLLELVQVDGADLRLPAGTSGPRAQELLDRVFGPGAARCSAGRILFDSTGYGFVQFADALDKAFGKEAFGPCPSGQTPPLFPLTTAVPNQGRAQAYDSLGGELIARHKGADAAWRFVELGNLRGRADDFDGAKDRDRDWILHG